MGEGAQGEETPASTRLRKLKEISRTAIVGMFGCWVAQVRPLPASKSEITLANRMVLQWIWWIGYIGVAGDT